jgi:hypothetical protein
VAIRQGGSQLRVCGARLPSSRATKLQASFFADIAAGMLVRLDMHLFQRIAEHASGWRASVCVYAIRDAREGPCIKF